MKTIQLTDREIGRVMAALRDLSRDHEKRADEAVSTARELARADSPETAGPLSIAEKMARDQCSLKGQADALIDRFEALLSFVGGPAK